MNSPWYISPGMIAAAELAGKLAKAFPPEHYAFARNAAVISAALFPQNPERTVDEPGLRTLNDTSVSELTKKSDEIGQEGAPAEPVKKSKRKNKRYDISAEKVASELGVTKRTVEYWDSGRNAPEGYTRQNATAYFVFRDEYNRKKALKKDARLKGRAIRTDFQKIEVFYTEPDGTDHKAGRYREKED